MLKVGIFEPKGSVKTRGGYWPHVFWTPRSRSIYAVVYNSPVALLVVHFLQATDAVALRRVSQFWKAVLQQRNVWRGLYCRDFYTAQAVAERKCVWVQLEGRAGRSKCSFHMHPRRFAAMASEVT